MMQKRRRYLSSLLSLCSLIVQPLFSMSAEALEMEMHTRQLTYLLWQQPELSSQNPDNDFLGLYRSQAHAELRPDINFIGSRYQLMLKPRFSYDHWWHKSGVSEDDDKSQHDIYLNEGLFQLELTPTLFTSYGRENLQWGPSYLRTPSNPFFRDNGRDNPKKEVEGKEFLKFVYLPNDWMTVSVISHLQQGGMRAETSVTDTDFKHQHALKLDMIGADYNASLVLSKQEGGNETLAGFVQATLNDALLAYFDGALKRGNHALYPRLDSAHPLGGAFVPQYNNTTEQRFIGIAGASYTLENSATLSLEYMYNGAGYNDTEAANYYTLRQHAGDNLHHPTLGGLARTNLGAALDPGLALLRRHYLLLQYAFNEMGNNLSYTLRWTANLDDQSNKLTLISEYAYNDHLQLFLIGGYNQGRSDSEFPSPLRSSLMLGLEYTF